MTAETTIPVTVVLRSYNDAALLPRTLAALDAQEGVDIRLSVFESASTDASPAILDAHGYDRIEHLAPGSYRSAAVLNTGAEFAQTELVAYVNSDAILEDNRVLRRLADAILADPQCAGSFGAQTIRPDADAMTRLDYDIAFSTDRSHLKEGAGWMSMVASMIRRSAWAAVRFDERLTFAEDAVWSEAVTAAGYTIAYVPDARAEHSHDYTWEQRYRRSFGDAAALAAIRRDPPARTIVGGFLKPLAKRLAKDAWRCLRRGRPQDLLRLPAHRWPQLRGSWDGARAGWDHFNHNGTGLQPVA